MDRNFRRDDCAGADQHAWPRDDALVDGLLELDVGICGAFRPEVADRGEASHEGCAEVIGRPRDAKAESLMQHLIVPAGFVVRMKQHVRMPLDEAGNDRRTGHVDHRAAGGVD